MAFFKKSASQNFDLYSTHAFYTPGVGGMFMLLALMLLGSLLGSLIVGIVKICGIDLNQDWTLLISYPCMFVPPMVYASYKGRNNLMFDKGYSLDSNNFAPKGALAAALWAVAGMLGLSVVIDPVNSLLPPMPKWLEDLLGSLTGGDFWINFICVSIFAPIFEEWLCRGMVLRGLLNRKKEDGSPLMSPAWAIVISAIFFGVIHLNPWQAIPAIAMGILMGYVYYKTGSLKITMLMHFANNTMALILGHIDSLKDMDSFMDVMPTTVYAIFLGVSVALVVGCIFAFRCIAPLRREGSCDEVSPSVE